MQTSISGAASIAPPGLNPLTHHDDGRVRVTPKIVAATVAGNALEFYDFLTYAFFAVFIGRTFFPTGNDFTSLLASVAVFGVGFVSRPLGGLLIGSYADRAGRKPAMILTIALITVGTMGLALTPSYESIGMAAPVIVVICRLIQGLALGGEVGPSSAFLVEIAPPNRRATYASWQIASQGLAAFVAGAVGMVVASMLSPAQVQSWGWRIPFALGLLLIPIAIYLRRVMPETLPGHDSGAPVASLWQNISENGRVIALSVLVIMGGTVSTYVGTYMTTYALTALKLPITVALMATVVGGLTTFACALLGGWLADQYGRKVIMILPRLLLIALMIPLFSWLVGAPAVNTLFVTTFILSALTAISGAASFVAIPELLTAKARATGLSIAYAIGVSLFGGTTQLLITWLINSTGNKMAPAYYVIFTSIITVIAMFELAETKDRQLAK